MSNLLSGNLVMYYISISSSIASHVSLAALMEEFWHL